MKDPAHEGKKPAAQETAKTSEPEQKEPDLGVMSETKWGKLGQYSDGVCHLRLDEAYHLLPTMPGLHIMLQSRKKWCQMCLGGLLFTADFTDGRFFHFSF